MTSEELALYEYLENASDGLSTVLRVPQGVSAALIAVAIAVAAVGGGVALCKLLAHLRGSNAGGSRRDGADTFRPGEIRLEAHYRVRAPASNEEHLQPPPDEQEAEDTFAVPVCESQPPFTVRPFWNSEHIWQAVIGGLLAVSAILALIVFLQSL